MADDRPPETPWEELLEEEVHQAKDSDVFSTPAVQRNDRLEAELERLPDPDQARVDRARRLAAAAAVQAGLKRNFHQGEKPVKRETQACASGDHWQV
jgi:hypothetical protein